VVLDADFPIRSTLPKKPFEWNGNKYSNKPYGLLLFGGGSDVVTTMDPHDPLNVEIGYRGRVNPIVPLASLKTLLDLGSFVQKFIETNLKPLPFFEDYRVLTQDWLHDCDHYTQDRKDQLLENFDEVYKGGDFVYTDKIFKCKSFPKREIYPMPKKVRLINSRTDWFKAIVGGCVHKMEKQVFSLPQFVKYYNPERLPKKLLKIAQFYYKAETDYTSFESCFVPSYTAQVELRLFRYMLKNNPKILKVVEASYYSKGKPRVNVLGNDHFVAHVIGSRMSGEMWTSLANGFSNLMNMKYLMATLYPNVKYECFVEGDDGILGLDQKCLRKEDFTSLGFNIKMTYHLDIRSTSFCGNLFDPDVLEQVINPGNIVRLFYTVTAKYLNARPKILTQLLRSKAMSLYTVGCHTPIVAILAWKIIQIIGFGKYRIDPARRFWNHRMLRHFFDIEYKKPVIDIRNRNIYEDKFGILIHDQLEIEKSIDAAQSLQDLCIHYDFLPFSDQACLI